MLMANGVEQWYQSRAMSADVLADFSEAEIEVLLVHAVNRNGDKVISDGLPC
jgi:hypothetical protein